MISCCLQIKLDGVSDADDVCECNPSDPYVTPNRKDSRLGVTRLLLASLLFCMVNPVGWKSRVEVMSDVENPGSQKNTLKIYCDHVFLPYDQTPKETRRLTANSRHLKTSRQVVDCLLSIVTELY